MKKSRIAKLSLMGASIAALAATLTTSTYAWYVSNKVATVKSGVGHTGSAGADGSVLLSWTNTNASVWTKELVFNDTDNGATDLSAVKLTPCHYATDGFYGIGASGAKGTKLTANATTDAGSYLQFVIYAKTESATPITVTPSIVINNTTQSLTGKTQLAYVGRTDGSPVDAGLNFAYNCLDSLYVKQTATASSGSGNSATAGAVTAETYVAASKSGVRGTTTAAIASSFQAAGAGDAHNYYMAVSGASSVWADEPACADADDPDNDVTAGTLSNVILTTTPVALTYTIFLDGGDVDCFNSCAGQDISFELKLTVNE